MRTLSTKKFMSYMLSVFIVMLLICSPSYARDIFQAAAHGTSREIEALYLAGEDVSEPNSSDGMTPLMVAAKYNESVDVIWTLLALGADAQAQNYKGETALDIAEMNGNLAVADALSTSMTLGYTSIFHAAMYGTAEEVEQMANAGANVNARYSGDYKYIDVDAAEVATGLADGMYAITGDSVVGAFAGIFGGLVGIAEQEAANKREFAGWTPLMFAVQFNESVDVVKTLIELGANALAEADDGTTAMKLARKNKNSRAVVALRRGGAE